MMRLGWRHGRGAALLAALTAIIWGPAAAQQTLQLTNGDRLTGTLTAVGGGTWTFELSSGELNIPAGTVQGFTTTIAIGLRLADGTILAATVSPAPGNQLSVTGTDGTTRTVSATDIQEIGDPQVLDELEPVAIGYFTPLDRFWGATVALGFSDKSGNSRARGLTANLDVSRETAKDRLTFRAGLSREEARVGTGEFETTVDKYFGSARADVFFGPRFFLFGFTRQERDTFQQIDLRSNYDLGLGLQLIAKQRTDLRLYSSGGARVENFTSGESESAFVWGAGGAFRQLVGPARFDWSLDWAPNVEDLEDYRLRSDASLTMTVFAGIGFRVGVLNELNNRPQPGVERHDMLVTSTLTYSIGR